MSIREHTSTEQQPGYGIELHVEDLFVKFATYYVVLYNYVLVRACVVYDFKDMTVCTHRPVDYTATTSRFYPRSDDICHLSPPFSHGRRCAIGYLGLTLRAWQGSRLPHTSSDRDTTLTHSTLPRPDSLRARDAVRNPASSPRPRRGQSAL